MSDAWEEQPVRCTEHGPAAENADCHQHKEKWGLRWLGVGHRGLQQFQSCLISSLCMESWNGDGTKVGGVAVKPKACAAVKASPGWQKPHALNANLTQNKGKGRLLGRNSPVHRLVTRTDLVGNTFGKVLVSSKMSVSQQSATEAAEGSWMLVL